MADLDLASGVSQITVTRADEKSGIKAFSTSGQFSVMRLFFHDPKSLL